VNHMIQDPSQFCEDVYARTIARLVSKTEDLFGTIQGKRVSKGGKGKRGCRSNMSFSQDSKQANVKCGYTFNGYCREKKGEGGRTEEKEERKYISGWA